MAITYRSLAGFLDHSGASSIVSPGWQDKLPTQS
jgi:hypothetical protein